MPERNDVDLLLVEDNPNDLELTLRALKRHNLGRRVFYVRDGAEALEFLFGACSDTLEGSGQPGQPKVIILDLKLPRIDGFEVLRRIKSDERTRAIPIVVLTSSQEDRDVDRSYELGVNSYVVKPVEFERFVQAVAELGLYWTTLNTAPR